MIERLEVPQDLHRNSAVVQAAGYERTGQTLIDLVAHSTGHKNFGDIDVLDVGCGVRFTQTIVNSDIPLKSYTGVEIHRPIVDFLQKEVEPHDSRFKYAHWNVHNAMYNPQGLCIGDQQAMPVDGHYDVICLISVFTHLTPTDSLALLKLMRNCIREDGKLFFSAYIDDELTFFEDRVKGHPLRHAYYGRDYMVSLIKQAGWKIESFNDKDDDSYIQHYFVCTPA
ncbi:MAG: class I SAM-dependent methyltransferase [Algicola sp.]|nr:class I SAM-dependent methyltransferase [Algicola sp.]